MLRTAHMYRREHKHNTDTLSCAGLISGVAVLCNVSRKSECDASVGCTPERRGPDTTTEADPFCSGSPPPETITAHQFDEKRSSRTRPHGSAYLLCLPRLSPSPLSFLSSFCAVGKSATHSTKDTVLWKCSHHLCMR